MAAAGGGGRIDQAFESVIIKQPIEAGCPMKCWLPLESDEKRVSRESMWRSWGVKWLQADDPSIEAALAELPPGWVIIPDVKYSDFSNRVYWQYMVVAADGTPKVTFSFLGRELLSPSLEEDISSVFNVTVLEAPRGPSKTRIDFRHVAHRVACYLFMNALFRGANPVIIRECEKDVLRTYRAIGSMIRSIPLYIFGKDITEFTRSLDEDVDTRLACNRKIEKRVAEIRDLPGGIEYFSPPRKLEWYPDFSF